MDEQQKRIQQDIRNFERNISILYEEYTNSREEKKEEVSEVRKYEIGKKIQNLLNKEIPIPEINWGYFKEILSPQPWNIDKLVIQQELSKVRVEALKGNGHKISGTIYNIISKLYQNIVYPHHRKIYIVLTIIMMYMMWG